MAGMRKDDPGLDVGLLVLRVVAGGVLFLYGSAKLLAWFGGAGFQGTLDAFQTNLGVPAWLGAMAVFAEFFGGLGLALGLLTRVAAFGALCTMAVAVYTKVGAGLPAQIGQSIAAHGAELFFPLTLAAMCLCLLATGAGRFSLDQRFFGRKGR